MAADHLARARDAWPHLVERARDIGTPDFKPFTYGELCGRIGIHHRAATWFLGVIQTYCETHKLPPLQALVVNKKTGRPGCGYTASRDQQRAISAVGRHDWPREAPF